jgi:hypothetical protein
MMWIPGMGQLRPSPALGLEPGETPCFDLLIQANRNDVSIG